MADVTPVSVEDGRTDSGSKKRRSIAWEHFERLPAADKRAAKAQCKHCKDLLSANYLCGTSHLLRHISKCPKLCSPDVVKQVSPISCRFVQGSALESSEFDVEVAPIRVNDDIVEDKKPESGSKWSSSKAWEYFEKLPSTGNGEAKAQCKFCMAVLAANGKTGISHLLHHTSKCPKICIPDVVQNIISANETSDGPPFVRKCRFDPKLVPVHALDENLEEDDRKEDDSEMGGSKAWEVFERLPAAKNGVEKARCKYCRCVFVASASSGSSHLLRHISRCPEHPHLGTKHQNFSAERKADVNSSVKNYDAAVVRREIAAMIVVDELPLSTVEGRGFRDLFSRFYPKFVMMSQKELRQEILSLYKEERKKVRKILATCTGRIGLTLDTWKSLSDDSYLCVTAHFIDNEWRLQKRILCFKFILSLHDSNYLNDEIASCLTYWNIEHKIISLTFGNVSSSGFVASNLNSKKSPPSGGALFNVVCCAHILSIIVQAGFGLIGSIIEKLHLFIKYIKRSPSRKKIFYDHARNLNLDTGKKLCIDDPHDWSSTYIMLEVALDYKDAFMCFGESDKCFKHSISVDEWKKVFALCNFLKVFYEVTRIFSGTKNPTANLYFKGFWKIHCCLSDALRGPPTFMTDTAKKMHKIFSDYWSEYSLILSCAALLDPRYKVKYVEYCFTKIYGDEGRQHVFTIVNTLRDLYSDYANGVTVVGTSYSDKLDNDEDDADYATFKSEIIETELEKSQVDRYLEEANKDINADLNVLEYWSLNERKYPELSRMARDVLTIPISTVPAESFFRAGHQVISCNRSSLKAKSICLRDWIQVYDRTGKSGLFGSKSSEEDSSSSAEEDC